MKSLNKVIALVCVFGLMFTSVIGINPIPAYADNSTLSINESESPTNIVENPGFEDTYTKNGTVLASGWTGWTASGQLNFSLDSTNKFSGNYSVKISSEVDARGGYIRSIPAVPGKTYKFSICVRTENTVKSSVGMRICINTSDGSNPVPPIYVPANTLSGNTDWTRIEKVVTMPQNTASVSFQCYYGVTKGSAWFDEAKVVEYFPNIVDNPGFEDTYTKDGTLLASGWTGWTASGQLNFSLDSTNKCSGNYSVKISSEVDARGGYIRNIPAVPGKAYKFSTYVKTENTVKSSVGMRICINKSDGSDPVPPIYVPANTLSGNTDWTRIEKIVTIPQNTASVSFQCYYGVTKGSAWFDEIKAVEYTPVTGLQLSSSLGAVKVGNSINVPVKVIPDNAGNKNVLWTSDNPSIAAVSEGVVTGISEGNTIITATTEEEGFSQKFVVYVSNTDMEILPTKTSSFSVDEDGVVNGTLDKTDTKGNPLTYSVCEYASNGLARVYSNGDFQYYPNKNFFGTDKFKAIAINGVGGIGLYNVDVTVNAANDSPDPREMIVGVVQGASVSGKATTIDIDKDSIAYAISSSPLKGTVDLTAAGDFTYTANNDSIGEDNFVVTASDNKGGASLFTVNVFIAPQGQKIINTLKSVNPTKTHPRINTGKETFDNLKLLLKNNDVYISKWFGNVKITADTILTLPPKEYEIQNGTNILEVSREVLRRARYLSMAYRMTGDSIYAERLWEELEKAGNFKDWSPGTFLDIAEMTNAFGTAYDWLYDYWSPERKSFMVKAIKEKGLLPGINAYNTGEWWTRWGSNWNGVCNGGLAVGALAVGDEADIDPEIEGIAATVLQNAVKSIPYILKEYMPDGAWKEGPIYWDYGTSYTIYMLSSMLQALGTDYGLSDIPGLDISTNFPIYNNGAKGGFNFADADTSIVRTSIMLWLGTRYNNPTYYWTHRVSGLLSGTEISDPMAMVWYPGYDKYSADAPPQKFDEKFRFVEVGTMHSDWYDANGTYLGFKGGDNQFPHGDLDIGSFVYDAYGVRWAMDLGSGDYNSPGYWDTGSTGGRWTYYRKRAEGHNTFVINPGNYPDQNVYAKAKIERFETNSNQTAAMSIVNLSEAYNADAFSARRGFSLTNNKTELLVQDEVRNRKPSDYWWFMHTNSNIEISSDGKSAILNNPDIPGRRLYVQILSDEGKFSVMDAVPLPNSPAAVQLPNSGVKKLAIHLENALDVKLAVRMVPLMDTDEIPTDKPAVVSLDNWKVKEESSLFVDGLSVAGTEVQNFDRYSRIYRVVLPYGTTTVPAVDAKVSDPDVNVDVKLPEALPGIAKVTVTSKTNSDTKNSYYIELAPDLGVTASTAQLGYWPEKTMDGDLITRWAAEGEQWIQYYIGEDQIVKGISVAYFWGNARKYKFDILVSEDGEHWETVLPGVQTSGTTSDLERYDFPETKAARYVRIFGHGSNVNRWNNIAEVNIHKLTETVTLSVDRTTVKPGDTAVLSVNVAMSDGSQADLSQAKIVYTSDNEQVAKVDGSGNITAIGEGAANIKASVTLYGITKETSTSILADGTPSVTAAKVDGTEKNGWYSSDATVTLSAADNLSGVDKTEYRLSDSGDWITYTAPVVITQDGSNTIQYRSTDKAGNVEEIKQEIVKLDTTAPVTTAAAIGIVRSDGTYNSHVSVTLAAEDAAGGSGVAGIEYSLDGTSWQAYSVPLEFNDNGTYTISYKSTDNAGNVEAVKSVSIIVSMDPDVMASYLKEKVNAMSIQGGIKNSLVSKLDNVLSSIADGNKNSPANKLNAFINEVDAQSGKKLTVEQADALKAEANKIITGINEKR